MKNNVELFYEPIEVIKKYNEFGNPEMTDRESAFLCGIIKKFRPKKIVEIGVAQGGTTALLFECLKRIQIDSCEIYSVDINTKCYSKPDEMTGFVAELYKKDGLICDGIIHKFILGETVASAISDIGDGVDFVILDTMHYLPGELLDCISVYKHLKEDAVIVFHDVAQSLNPMNSIYGSPLEFASLVTLTVLAGDKYYLHDDSKISNYGNIAAIQINEHTKYTISNLFDALYLSWNYLPYPENMKEYRDRILDEYGEDKAYILDRAFELNSFSLYRQGKITVSRKKINELLDYAVNTEKELYIFGTGVQGRLIKKYFEKRGRNISDFIVSSNKYKNSSCKVIDEIEWDDNKIIVLGVPEQKQLEVIRTIGEIAGMDKMLLKNGLGFREMMDIISEEFDEEYINHNGYAKTIKSVENTV